VDLGLKEEHYLTMAKAGDGFAGFRLCREEKSRLEPSTLWIVPFKDSRKVEAIATDVTDFTLLGRGNVVYATGGPRAKDASENRQQDEAFFHVRADRSPWNVLDGVARLP